MQSRESKREKEGGRVPVEAGTRRMDLGGWVFTVIRDGGLAQGIVAEAVRSCQICIVVWRWKTELVERKKLRITPRVTE